MIVAIAAIVGSASAASAAPRHNPRGHFLGVVPSARAQGRATPQAQAKPGNLTYHNGPVMHSNRTHAIYWEPASFTTSSTYKALINGYLGGVAADSGKHGNVYASDVQYTDGTGHAAYDSSFAGAIVDTKPYPASGCTDSGTSVCLTDLQIQTELNRVIADNSLPRGLGDIYFVMTPEGVGSCTDPGSPTSSPVCAYSDYCAYHSDFKSGSEETLYADQPYGAVPSCDSGEHPNGSTADATINLISHEHNETITDPLGTAWWDSVGNENGDKCAWNFGTALGSTSSGQYNQLIDSGDYFLQQEWSNASSGCVLTVANRSPSALFGFSPSSPTTSQTVSFDGTASSDPDGTIGSYSWDFGDGATGAGVTPSHSYTDVGTYTVTLTVTDNDGARGTISHSVTVGDRPPIAVFTFAPSSPAAGQSIGFDGSGSTDPDGTVTTYSWDFGDGATGAGVTPSHSYAQAGTYTVTLTVTDNTGNTGHVSQAVTVRQSSSGVTPASGGPAGVTQSGSSPATGGALLTPSGTPSSPLGGGPALPARARLNVPSQALLLSPTRMTTLRLDCRSSGRCRGTIGIYVDVTTRSAHGSRTRSVLLGNARFSIAGLKTVGLRLRLARLAAALLRSHTHVRVTVRATVENAAAGSAAVARPVWLQRAPTHRR